MLNKFVQAMLGVILVFLAALGIVSGLGCATAKDASRLSSPIAAEGREDFLRCVANTAQAQGYEVVFSDMALGSVRVTKYVPGTMSVMEHTNYINASVPKNEAQISSYTEQTVINMMTGKTQVIRDVADELVLESELIRSTCLPSAVSATPAPSDAVGDGGDYDEDAE